MARKTHRPDDILWTVTAADIEATRREKTEVTLGAVLDTRYPRKSLVKLFEEKLIHINGHKATPKDVISEGDEIWIAMAKEKIDYEPIELDLHILYEDDDLLIVDKPVGVTVNSKDQVSLANGVAYYFKENGIKRKVRFLNRLDRDTTGCIVIAKSGLAQSLYQQQMDDNTFEKWYMASVEGIVEADEDSLILPMDRSTDGIHYEVNPKGKETRTDYSVLCRHSSQPVDNHGANVDKSVHNSSKGGYTEVLVRLYTGKTHQIRVAFSYIGHPLVGDTLYGAQSTGQPFQLRAQKVVFTHMRTGERITVTA